MHQDSCNFKKHLFRTMFPSAPADHQVSCSPSLCAGRSGSSRWLAAHQVYRRAGRSPPVAPRRSLPANCDAQVSPRQSHSAGLSLPIAPALAGHSPPIVSRRYLPANRAAQVSPRQLCRAGLSPLIAPPWTALSTPWLHWISCKTRSTALDQGLGRCQPTCVQGGGVLDGR